MVRALEASRAIQRYWLKTGASILMTRGSATPSKERLTRGNRHFGLGLIREKPPTTQRLIIILNVPVINLKTLLELLFILFAVWTQILTSSPARQYMKRSSLGY